MRSEQAEETRFLTEDTFEKIFQMSATLKKKTETLAQPQRVEALLPLAHSQPGIMGHGHQRVERMQFNSRANA
eukprot:655783-Rhodomonas_salina.1